jgi:hypothetical protein
LKGIGKEFSKCLKRIFILCDRDKDGLLSDIELSLYEETLFNTGRTMRQEDIKFIKNELFQIVT